MKKRPGQAGLAANALHAALAAHAEGDLDRAETAYRAILQSHPSNGDALNLLGVLMHQTGRPQEALPLLLEATRVMPGFADAHSNLGMALLALGNVEQARSALDRAIGLNPKHWNARGMRAEVFLRANAWGLARTDLEVALSANPGWTEGWYRLSSTCRTIGDHAGARTALLSARASQPGDPFNQLRVGIGLRDAGDSSTARTVFEEAAIRWPDDAQIHCQLGWTDIDERLYLDAIDRFEASIAVATAPARLDALIGLGVCHLSIGNPELAVEALSEARRIDDRTPTLQCPWLSAMVLAPKIGKEDRLRQHREWAARHAVDVQPPLHARRQPPWRIGLLSGDLRNHAVSRFVLPWIAHVDRARFEYHAYSFAAHEDSVSDLMRPHFSAWQNVANLSDERLRETIRSDGIDILVDLAGHTYGSRIAVLAERAAPIQATWLGYPETTGLSTVDFRITDSKSDPDGEDSFATEHLARMDGGFLCYAPIAEEAEAEPKDTGRTHFAFGCFNNLSKVNPEVIETFAAILRNTPGSSLLLKHFAMADPRLRQWLLNRFSAHGIEESRVLIAEPATSHREHLEHYNRVDLALDTFPYNGTTTTCEALWMGVPVLTLRGDRHAGRVGASILAHSLEGDARHWIAEDRAQYVARAVATSMRGTRPLNERRSLRARVEASPLMDGPGFADRIEEMLTSWLAVPTRHSGKDRDD